MRVRSAGRHRSLALVTGLVTLATTVTTVTSVAPAQAAGPAWRVVKTYNNTRYNTVDGVVALSSKNAWALGGTNAAQPSASRPLAQHWNGRTWKSVALPGGLRGGLYGGDHSSASNAWAIGGDEWENSFALRWNGRKWSTARKWTQGQVTDVAAVSAKDVWVFGGSGFAPGAGTWHFNGKSWTRPSLPFDPFLAGKISGKNIWAIGRSAGGDARTVGHWDGTKWSVVNTGSALPPDMEGPGTTQSVNLQGILARSAKDVWISGSVYNKPAGGRQTMKPVLAHFNGRSWKRVTAPSEGTIPDIASDGKGGLWFAGSLKGRGVLRHRSSIGKWTTAEVVGLGTKYAVFSDLALIPGTTRLFATGQVHAKNNSLMAGAIFRRS